MDGVDRVDLEQDRDLPEGTWTVNELNREIESVLNDAHSQFPTHVVGEIAEVDEYDFGTFFEFRDLDEEPSISCIAWSSTLAECEYELEEGTKGIVEAHVDFYPERGDCQLLVSEYWPLGESQRHQQLEALRKELAGAGLFDDARKQPIPPYPSCIGLVTSPSGSAREDVWAAVNERSPSTDVLLCGATVQGENAVPSLIHSIRSLDAEPQVETIIVTRGGGSDVDLWSFNAEPLVRTVAGCSTPVVVAIGHEDDETLVEDAADARAMTPTEAGVIATTSLEAVQDDLGTAQRRVEQSYRALVTDSLERVERRLTTAYETLKQQVAQQDSLRQRTRDLERRVTVAYDTLAERRLDKLDTRIERGLGEIELATESKTASERVARGRIHDLERRLDGAYETQVDRQLDALEHRIDSAYRDVEADERVRAGRVEARRLRVVVAALVAIIVLGTIAVALFAL